MTIKNDSDLLNAITILKESHKRINKALKSGETTGYFAGGGYSASKPVEIDETEETV